MTIFIGTAGWAIGSSASATAFPAGDSNLERYASVFPAVEINSSFHRPHRPSTWQRWRDSVPDSFRFSVKIPKTISHEQKLISCGPLLGAFLDQANLLHNKLAVLLLQLPPKLNFESDTAEEFFVLLRSRSSTPIVCEPRHASWFSQEANALLCEMRVARVAADPARHKDASSPGGWSGLSYFRLHGSPVIYRSSYRERVADYARQLQKEGDRPTWCIFDNTASSAAVGDALSMQKCVRAFRDPSG